MSCCRPRSRSCSAGSRSSPAAGRLRRRRRSAIRMASWQQEVNTALMLAAEFFWFWHPSDTLTEGYSWLKRTVELDPEAQDPGLRARVLFGLGAVLWGMGEAESSRRLLEQSARLNEE